MDSTLTKELCKFDSSNELTTRDATIEDYTQDSNEETNTISDAPYYNMQHSGTLNQLGIDDMD